VALDAFGLSQEDAEVQKIYTPRKLIDTVLGPWLSEKRPHLHQEQQRPQS